MPLAVRVRAKLCVVMSLHMAHPLVFSNEASARAGCEGTRVFRIDIMSCSNMSLEIVICSEGGFVFAILHSAHERINVNIVEMCLEEIPTSVGCFRTAFVPSTFPAGTPLAANLLSVVFNVTFVLLNAIEHAKRKTMRPIASKISDRNLRKINIRKPRRR
jgi:hypothetical protein